MPARCSSAPSAPRRSATTSPGPNHVLPTGRTARFASGLSVFDFLKRTTWVAADAAALARVGPAAIALAEAEGLHAHARSIALRLCQRGVLDLALAPRSCSAREIKHFHEAGCRKRT